VDVLDRKDRQALWPQFAQEALPGFEQPPARVGRLAPALRQRQPDHPRERLPHRCAVGRKNRRDRRVELGRGQIASVRLEDPCELFRRLGKGPVRDAVAVRNAPPPEQPRSRETIEELAQQARLADAGVAEDGDELRNPLPLHSGRERFEDRQLGTAADQRRRETRLRPAARLRRRAQRFPGRDVGPLSLRFERRYLPVGDDPLRRAVRPSTHEHLAGLGVLLQARRNVDGVAADHQLAACGRLPARDHLAGVHSDPQPDIEPVTSAHACGEDGEGVSGTQRSPDRTLRVVLVRERDSEHRHDRVADELLRDAAGSLDLAVHQLEQLRLQRPNVFGIEAFAERSRACQVGEEDRDDTALLALFRRRRSPRALDERRTARRAERCGGVLFRAAHRAPPGEGSAAGTAETGARRLFGAA
jgi:hypothetical protein